MIKSIIKHRCVSILLFTLSIAVSLSLFFTISNNISQSKEITKYHNTILALLYDSIIKALVDHYGGFASIPQLALSEASVEIEPKDGWSYSYVIVDAYSFYGPERPPFAIEKMVFDIELGKIKLISYTSHPINYPQKK